jgi:YD repeat-containing protein
MNKLATLLLFFAFCWKLNAQQNNATFPSSPNANAIEKYGNIPLDFYNGSMPIHLPLPSLQTKNGFELPVYIQYNSNGVKVNDYPGSMGMSWSLFAGGLISRNILGADDFSPNGYYNQAIQLPEEPLSDSCNGLGSNYWNQIIQLSNQGKSPFAPDARPDEHYFHAAGLHGKFQYLPDKVPSFSPFVNAQVYVNFNQVGNPSAQMLSFKLVDEEQNNYYFKEMEFSTISYLPGGNPLGPYISAIYLSDIVTKDGEQIHFEYEKFAYEYQAQSQDVFSASLACGHASQHEKTIQVLRVNTPILKRITYHQQEILFDYFPSNYFDDKQLLLQSIEYRTASTLTKKYAFTYQLETNKTRAWLQRMEQIPVKNYSGINPSYEFQYHYHDSLPERLSLKQDYWGYYNANSSLNSTAPIIPNYLFQTNCNASNDQIDPRPMVSRDTDSIRIQYGSLKRIVYPTGGYSVFDMQAHVFSHPDLWKYLHKDSMQGAGLRLSTICNYDVDGRLLLRKHYNYIGGKIMTVPLHYYQTVQSCGSTVSFLVNSSSVPVIQTQFSAKGQLVGYDQVDEFLMDSLGNQNGKMSRFYFNQCAKQSAPISVGSRWRSSAFYLPVFDFQNSMLFYHPNTPINNDYETRNGTLLAESTFALESNQFRLIEKNEYSYELIPLHKIKGKIAQFPVCPNYTFTNCDFLVYYQYQNNHDYFRLKQKNQFKYARGIQLAASPFLISEMYEYDPTIFYRVSKKRIGNSGFTQRTDFTYLNGDYIPFNSNDYFRPNYLSSIAVYRNDFLLSKQVFNYDPEWLCVGQVKLPTNLQFQPVQLPLNYETKFSYHADRTIASKQLLPHPKTWYIWDQEYDKIGLEISNADSNDFAYSSFEPGLSYRINDIANAVEFNENAKTGKWILNLAQTQLQFELNPNTYTLSFWFKGPPDQIQFNLNNAVLVSHSVKDPDPTEWAFYDCILQINQTTTVNLFGDLQIDEFKVHPLMASMKTNSYTAEGLQSSTQPDHSITYYDYDAFGHVSTISNSDGNILKNTQTTYIH